jgi:site-specific DNA-methyltransferase (adenine-specific)
MSDHRVVLADCLGPEGLATLPDKSVDHVITDPPYEAEAHTLQRRQRGGKGCGMKELPRGYGVEYVPLSFAPIADDERRAVAREIARLARRWVIVFCQVEAAMKWRDALVAGGLRYVRTCVWVKPDATPQFSGDRPGMGYESFVVCHAIGRTRWNAGGRRGVYEAAGDRERQHETQKPLALMEALIRDFTDEGETILDPFAGSGTTGVACRRLGRRFIGFERDPKYAAIAEKRIAGAREQLRFFDGTGT